VKSVKFSLFLFPAVPLFCFSQVTSVTLRKEVRVKQWFKYIDSLTASLQKQVSYPVSEHIIVRHNPWIIDRLASFDYYDNMAAGRFIYDQDTLVLLNRGDQILIPDEAAARKLDDLLKNTLIDVNIPEFKLRIYEYGILKYTFTVRVGKNTTEYVGSIGRELNLRTPVGEGTIYRISREPAFYSLKTGKRYYTTLRDDGRRTRMPMIPWLDPELDGKRPGTMLHPTTNPVTLGKAYSHGCVGTREHDAWIIYYHAPVGTAVKYRYCIEVIDEEGKKVTLKDIYGYGNKKCRP
jgi:L,D-transpeptidase ErfK/SrfK